VFNCHYKYATRHIEAEEVIKLVTLLIVPDAYGGDTFSKANLGTSSGSEVSVTGSEAGSPSFSSGSDGGGGG
jgi:hypothetical protein